MVKTDDITQTFRSVILFNNTVYDHAGFEGAVNPFLSNIERLENIIGTLSYVGCGKRQIEDIPKILAEKDRKQAGITAPAHGLTLYAIHY